MTINTFKIKERCIFLGDNKIVLINLKSVWIINAKSQSGQWLMMLPTVPITITQMKISRYVLRAPLLQEALSTDQLIIIRSPFVDKF